jgi:hypothetical protein
LQPAINKAKVTDADNLLDPPNRGFDKCRWTIRRTNWKAKTALT